MRMDWPLPKGRKETGTDAMGLQSFWECWMSIWDWQSWMNSDTNLSVYIFLFIYSIYIYRMPTMCLLWTTCDQRGRQIILSRLSGTSLWCCSWKLLNKLGRDIISVTFTSSCSKHYIEELPLFYFPFQIILHYFQSKFLRGYTICSGYRSAQVIEHHLYRDPKVFSST